MPQVTGCLTSSIINGNSGATRGQLTPNGTSTYNNDIQNSHELNKLNMSNGECKKGK